MLGQMMNERLFGLLLSTFIRQVIITTDLSVKNHTTYVRFCAALVQNTNT